MPSLFVCLANSRKYSGRCIAGVELIHPSTRPGFKYDIAHHADGRPRWVRPVSDGAYGEIANFMVAHVNLLDVVRVDITERMATGYQSENVAVDLHSELTVVDHIPIKPDVLDKLCTPCGPELFGSRGRALPTETIDELDYSLMLIAVAGLTVKEQITPGGNFQLRGEFCHQNTWYNLPITDVDFNEAYDVNPRLLENCQHFYLCLSVGMEYKGWHYKLIAGVVYF